MKPKENESGMDALRRLSRQTSNLGQKMKEEEQQKAAYEKNVQGVVQGLRGISFSVALSQLNKMTTPEIYRRVQAMQKQNDSGDLRRLITELIRSLERNTAKAARSNRELEPVVTEARTLAILISLLFSLK